MSEMNATPATEAATSETQDFLSSVGESERRVRVSGKAVSDEVVLSAKDVNVYYGDHHALHNTSLDFHKGEAHGKPIFSAAAFSSSKDLA